MPRIIIYVPADCEADCADDECNHLHRDLYFVGDVAYFAYADAERAALASQ